MATSVVPTGLRMNGVEMLIPVFMLSLRVSNRRYETLQIAIFRPPARRDLRHSAYGIDGMVSACGSAHYQSRDRYMLRSMEQLLGYRVMATDGSAGKVTDFLLLDDRWDVAWVVAGVNRWPNRRRVLLRPRAVAEISETRHRLFFALTREEVA